jgi:hypothetical protein
MPTVFLKRISTEEICHGWEQDMLDLACEKNGKIRSILSEFLIGTNCFGKFSYTPGK